MLVLTRREGQKVIMVLPDGRQIEMKVDRVGRKTTRLLFDAPADVTIDREEIFDDIQAKRGGAA